MGKRSDVTRGSLAPWVRRAALLVAAMFMIAWPGSAAFCAPKETVIYRFSGAADGAEPQAPLIADKKGRLYGTTYTNGANGGGTIFQIAPPEQTGSSWSLTTIYTFCSKKNCADGSLSTAGLLEGNGGVLYGTTNDGPGCGTVFALSPPKGGSSNWRLKTLHAFQCYPPGDGSDPTGELISDASGNLYATTWGGGTGHGGAAPGGGTVFQLAPPSAPGGEWSETVLYSFCQVTNCIDGAAPFAALVSDASGALYGTTVYGGQSNYGAVFKLSPPTVLSRTWNESVLWSFTGGVDSCYPSGKLIFDSSGALYGTASGASAGCPAPGLGTVFKLTPPAGAATAWTMNVLHSFCASKTKCSDGGWPAGGLVFDSKGDLYGQTEISGDGSGGFGGGGIVFELSPLLAGSPTWKERILHDFGFLPGDGNNGGIASPSLLLLNNELFGTTASGGIVGACGGTCGTVFEVKP